MKGIASYSFFYDVLICIADHIIMLQHSSIQLLSGLNQSLSPYTNLRLKENNVSARVQLSPLIDLHHQDTHIMISADHNWQHNLFIFHTDFHYSSFNMFLRGEQKTRAALYIINSLAVW